MSLIAIIKASPLSAEDKRTWIARVEAEGETDALIAEQKDALQEYIDAGFAKAGIEIDDNDPTIKKAFATMESTIAQAQDDYNQNMARIDAETKDVANHVSKQLDGLQAQMIKASITAE